MPRAVAVVIGAASGIGRSLCPNLVRRGVQVMAGDVNEEGLAAVVRERRNARGSPASWAVNVADKE